MKFSDNIKARELLNAAQTAASAGQHTAALSLLTSAQSLVAAMIEDEVETVARAQEVANA